MEARRVVAYCRTSTTKQDVSLEAQEENIRAYCKIKGLEVTDVIIDRDEFSGNLNRPGVQKIIKMAEAGKLSTVATYKLDRMTRSVKDALNLVELFNKQNVCFISVMESLDTKSPMGMFFVQMTAAIAELERKTIGHRTEAALAHIKSTGCPVGPAPYGWKSQPRPVIDGKRQRVPLVPDADEQQIIRIAVSHDLAGWTLTAIADELNGAGLRTRSGSLWNKQYVGRILKSTLSQIPVAI